MPSWMHASTGTCGTQAVRGKQAVGRTVTRERLCALGLPDHVLNLLTTYSYDTGRQGDGLHRTFFFTKGEMSGEGIGLYFLRTRAVGLGVIELAKDTAQQANCELSRMAECR